METVADLERHGCITVSDDGSGFPPEIMARLGDPYITRRRPRAPGQPGGGLGLGFFIAKTLLERSGASIDFENRSFPDRGAVIRIHWTRSDFERLPGPAALE